MKISIDDVRHVATLARLRLGEDEERRLVDQLDAILGYVDKLNELDDELDAAAVPPTSHVLEMAAPLREDRVTNGPDADRLLENAPDRVGTFFRVPRILDPKSLDPKSIES